MISAIIVFNSKGEVIISRLFRSGLRRSSTDVFRLQVISNPGGAYSSPVLTFGSTTFCYIRDNGLYYVAVSRMNADVGLVFEFLYKFKNLLFRMLPTVSSSNFGHSIQELNNKSSSILSNNLNNNLNINSNSYNNNSNSSNSSSDNNNQTGITEDLLKANFTLIYEILDEVLDYGYPQLTDSVALKPHIFTEAVNVDASLFERSEKDLNNSSMNNTKSSISRRPSLASIPSASRLSRMGSVFSRRPSNPGEKFDKLKEKSFMRAPSPAIDIAQGPISWRQPGIKYRKNQVFVDVFENVNLILSNKGSVLSAEVAGKIVMKSHLSGIPECKFGLNDSLLLDDLQESTDNIWGSNNNNNNNNNNNHNSRRRHNFDSEHTSQPDNVFLEDCHFHQCVRLGKFDADRTISFVPPDGDFDLMSYRAVRNINVPFRVVPIVNAVGTKSVEYNVTVKAMFADTSSSSMSGASLCATDVEILIPVPLNARGVNDIYAQHGKAKYYPGENAIVWKIPKFNTGAEFVFSAIADLAPSVSRKPWARPPISMKFTISMYSASGLVVRYLKIFEKSNYKTVKWVRYLSRAGSYEIRI